MLVKWSIFHPPPEIDMSDIYVIYVRGIQIPPWLKLEKAVLMFTRLKPSLTKGQPQV